MKTTIYCKTTSKGIQSFYMVHENEEYFLFSQNFRRGVKEYYGQGVSLDKALDFSKSNRNSAITRTMTKLPIYIKYIETEYEITVLNKTKKKHSNKYKKCA